MSIIENAKRIAERAHAHQRRKWGSQPPYIVHPARVAAKVATLSGATDEDVAAAWLHDVIEDVAIPTNTLEEYRQEIREACGEVVLQLVLELTNPTEGPEWAGRSRAEKRAKDWEHLAQISDRAKRIKLCDRLDNISDMGHAPKRLILKYIPESKHLCGMCGYVDEGLARELTEAIERLGDASWYS